MYDAFFPAVGVLEWHGRNHDALADSISGGSINQVEVPYLVIQGYDRIGPDAKVMADSFIRLIIQLGPGDCPLETHVEGQ